MFTMWNAPVLFSDLYGRGSSSSGAVWYPKFNVTSDDQGIRLTADIPGVKASDLDISVEGSVLTIKGSRKDHGSFRKAYDVSDDYDTGAITASLEDGVLTVTLPKAARAQPRRIPVAEPKQLTS